MSRSALVVAVLMLAACGQAGPLYLPDRSTGSGRADAADPQAAQPQTTIPPTQEPQAPAPLASEPPPEPQAQPKKE